MNQSIVNALYSLLLLLPAKVAHEVVAIATVATGVAQVALVIAAGVVGIPVWVTVGLSVVVLYGGVIAARGNVKPV